MTSGVGGGAAVDDDRDGGWGDEERLWPSSFSEGKDAFNLILEEEEEEEEEEGGMPWLTHRGISARTMMMMVDFSFCAAAAAAAAAAFLPLMMPL